MAKNKRLSLLLPAISQLLQHQIDYTALNCSCFSVAIIYRSSHDDIKYGIIYIYIYVGWFHNTVYGLLERFSGKHIQYSNAQSKIPNSVRYFPLFLRIAEWYEPMECDVSDWHPHSCFLLRFQSLCPSDAICVNIGLSNTILPDIPNHRPM